MTRTTFTRSLAALLLAAGLAGLGAGCGSTAAEDPILRMSAAEALARGKELMEQDKHNRARKFLSHAFEVEPNSRAGREGLLLLADSYYLAGNQANWIQAEAKYRDFLNRFPTSDQAAYAQYQIANSLAERVEKPNRDQSATYKAVEAYRELIRLYPTSEYAAEAQAKIQEVEDQLAAHEFVVGDFYLRYRFPAAAAGRFEELLERFPEYTERDKVLYHLGVAYLRSRQPELRAKAAPTFRQLEEEHPESRWVGKIPSELPSEEVPAPADEAAGAGADDEEGAAT
jgi:outer membrane protein assembly factor BamD